MSPPCRLYLLTPPAVEDLAAFADDLRDALSGGDVAALQIRLKSASEDRIGEILQAISPIAQANGVAVIMNDRPDLARRFGCDGVHIGQSDMPLAEARRVLGREAAIGVTCHASRHLAMEAAEAGADYVAFGAFFGSTTKDASYRADPEILSIWQETMTIPCVAIGGVTALTAAGLAAAGADFLAVCAGVWSHPDGAAAAVTAFNREIAEGVARRPTGLGDGIVRPA